MIDPADRLFDLLPVVHRQRDAAAGWPLAGIELGSPEDAEET